MRIIGNNPAADNAEITAVASGTLPSGKTVIVNADGTVSVVAETAVSQSVGTSGTFHADNTQTVSSTYDANSNKVVVAFSDPGDGDKGKAIVGTISGTNISFGSEVVFDSGVIGGKTATYDAASQKVVISYTDASNSQYGTSIVGTVSGTSISFGSKTVFQSSTTVQIASTFDSASNKVVICYTNQGNSYYGTAIVGTVSGTSISFGTAAVWNSNRSDFSSIAFDVSANKVVISYASATGVPDNFGKAIVGTISGTGISFGSSVVFESAQTEKTSIVYDANAEKVVIAYRDGGNSDYGTAIVGTVSGTSISFGTAVVFQSISSEGYSATFDVSTGNVIIAYREGSSGLGYVIAGTVSGTAISFATRLLYQNNGVDNISIAYNSTEEKSVISYRSYTNNYGTSIVYTGAGAVTNLTTENFIGFANGAAADGGAARVQIGSGINTAQSSLTAGQQYFVQTDGTIGLTAADPSVIAGTAISATEIIVKG